MIIIVSVYVNLLHTKAYIYLPNLFENLTGNYFICGSEVNSILSFFFLIVPGGRGVELPKPALRLPLFAIYTHSKKKKIEFIKQLYYPYYQVLFTISNILSKFKI